MGSVGGGGGGGGIATGCRRLGSAAMMSYGAIVGFYLFDKAVRSHIRMEFWDVKWNAMGSEISVKL